MKLVRSCEGSHWLISAGHVHGNPDGMRYVFHSILLNFSINKAPLLEGPPLRTEEKESGGCVRREESNAFRLAAFASPAQGSPHLKAALPFPETGKWSATSSFGLVHVRHSPVMTILK